MTHSDPVRAELRAIVLTRDLQRWEREEPRFRQRRGLTPSIRGCMAVFLAPITSGPCSGKLTLDHVKDQPRLGKRAPSDPLHLVSLCDGHTERGMKAGFQWNTANRPLLRWYLDSLR
jgi:hypothetical protein